MINVFASLCVQKVWFNKVTLHALTFQREFFFSAIQKTKLNKSDLRYAPPSIIHNSFTFVFQVLNCQLHDSQKTNRINDTKFAKQNVQKTLALCLCFQRKDFGHEWEAMVVYNDKFYLNNCHEKSTLVHFI